MARLAIRHLAFALAFVLAGLAGRTTTYDETGTSLVWPAAGVAVLWWMSTPRRHRRVVVLPLALAAFAVNWSTGADAKLALVFTVTNVLQAILICWLLERPGGWWLPVTWNGPFNRPAHLMRLMTASVAGTLLPAVIGVVGLWLLFDFFTVPSSLVWWGRNAVGAIAIVAAGLLLRATREERHAAKLRRRRRNYVELVALVGVTVALVAADLSEGYLPLSVFLPAMTVWAGTRFPPVVVALHSVLAGVAAVSLTLHGQGPFSLVSDAYEAALLAQVFVGSTVGIGLALALFRSENNMLTAQLRGEREALAGYARTAAHDLLNPLTAIRGWIEIIADTPADKPLDHAAVERVASGAARMEALVKDLLADAQSHDLAVETEVVDMTELALAAAETYPAVRVRVDPLPTVLGDAGMLEQVMTNLIGNSVKYAAPERDPEITVTGSQRDGTVTIRVWDRGIGIPEDQRAQVFESFQRVPGTQRPGTGLGLSIVKSIVARHAGTIVARGRDDGPGTVIEMTLPGAAG